ncbi:hypothetical protein [Kitasatospora sp. NPDC087271]|uniref:hypothetical protein n=1 Tax=Kitasatospora sp. NPDC087271 TaxID=3364067 RepID=UPI0037FA49B4
MVRSLSSAKERSVDAAFGFALSNEVDVDVWMITAPLGFGIAKAIAKGGVSAGVRGNLEFSNSWAEETSVSQGENTARTTKVSLTGHWEDPGRLLNPATGRRYVPANTGFAVVQSQTADVFAGGCCTGSPSSAGCCPQSCRPGCRRWRRPCASSTWRATTSSSAASTRT